MEEFSMRHNRKAVMAERYKLYMKKNFLNGRYLVRNIQIGIAMFLVLALVMGLTAIVHLSNHGAISTKASVSVKEALFGVEEQKVSESEDVVSEVSKEIMDTETVSTELMISESVAEVMAVENSTEGELTSESDESIEPAMVEEEQKVQSKFDDRCIANVEGTLNIRQQPDVDAEFVGSMNQGAIAKVVGTDGEWTKIKSGDVEGYVLSDYVLTGKAAEEFSEDYVTLRGSVLEDGVNIREKASTDSDILQVLNKDDTVSVMELPKETEKNEAVETDLTDAGLQAGSDTIGISEQVEQKIASNDVCEEDTEQSWISVMLEDGRTGYVSADLVDVEELYELAVSAEELQRIAEAEAEAKRVAEEEAASRAMAATNATPATSNTTTTASNNSNNNNKTNDTDYQGAVTTPVTATESGECIGTFTITAYCGCKKCSGGHGKTASGTTPTEGRTIAADTSILPYGTQVVIDGVVYTVEDCGSGVSGNHIDIFFATHEKAMAYGRRSVKVYKY